MKDKGLAPYPVGGRLDRFIELAIALAGFVEVIRDQVCH